MRTSSLFGRRSRALLSVASLLTVFGLTAVSPAIASVPVLTVVENLTATVTASGTVTVEWDPPTGDLAGDYYSKVYYRVAGTDTFQTINVGLGVTEQPITGLSGGTSYEIVVSVTPNGGANDGEEGCNIDPADGCTTNPALWTSTSVTAATSPAAPTIVTVNPGDGQVEVEFSPGSTNGATVQQYSVTCGSVTETGTSSPVTVSSLTNGLAVTCTVTAEATPADSSSSAASESVTPSTTPDQMDAPTISAGSGSVTVTWEEVLATDGVGVSDTEIDDGGDPLDGFDVLIMDADCATEVTTGSAGADVTSLVISSASIENGTTYKAKVRAKNGNGEGEYSACSATGATPAGADVTAPTITVGRTGSGTVKAGGTASITFTLSESTTGFAADDISVSGGTVGSFAGSGTSYTATFTPTASSSGTATISVAVSRFTDSSGNNNTASNTLSISYDTAAPTITVGRSGSGTLTTGGTASITFTLSESSSNFAVGDVSVSGGTVGSFAGSGTSYTATFTLTASGTGTATVSVSAGTFTDAATNSNTASNTLSISYDTAAPTITVGRSDSGTLTTGGTASITFTLSESSSNFAVGDVSVSGGTVGSFAGSGTSYTATFTLTASGTGTATVSVSAGTFTDAATNSNTASNTLSISYDTEESDAPPTESPSPSTTVAPAPVVVPTTTTTVPPAAPSISVPPRLGTEVRGLPEPLPKVAEDATVAVRPGSLAVLIDPPDLPRNKSIASYVITITPVGGGRPYTKVIEVTSNDQVLRSRFTGIAGSFRVTISAVNLKGRTVGTWTTGTIRVRRN